MDKARAGMSYLRFVPRVAALRPTLSAEAPSHPRQGPPVLF